MKKTTIFFTLVVVTLLLVTSMNSCKDKPTDSKNTTISKSATVEELGQMNRDFAKALTAKDAVAAAIVYGENWANGFHQLYITFGYLHTVLFWLWFELLC